MLLQPHVSHLSIFILLVLPSFFIVLNPSPFVSSFLHPHPSFSILIPPSPSSSILLHPHPYSSILLHSFTHLFVLHSFPPSFVCRKLKFSWKKIKKIKLDNSDKNLNLQYTYVSFRNVFRPNDLLEKSQYRTKHSGSLVWKKLNTVFAV